MNQWPTWLPLRQNLRELSPYGAPQIPAEAVMNTNENPYPPSPKVVEAVQAVLTHQADALRLYPDPDATALKQAIAKQQHVDVAQVFVGNGSDEVLAHIFKAFFIQKEPILYPDITYSFYPVYCNLYDISFKNIPLKEDFSIEINDYLAHNQGKNGGLIYIAIAPIIIVTIICA